MCLILLAWQCHPRLPLLVAANRDEFHARPSRRLLAETDTGLICGRDLEAGGTWLGVSRSGRFAVVTNFRDANPPADPRSRGELIDGFLASDLTPQSWLAALEARAGEYRGFSVLLGDADALWGYSNRVESAPMCLTPGVHGLSNAALNDPWPKVVRGTAGLRSLVDLAAGDDARWRERTFELLRNEEEPAPDEVPASELPAPLARRNARMFIRDEHYGTRASTLVSLRGSGEIEIHERAYGPAGAIVGTHGYRLQRLT